MQKFSRSGVLVAVSILTILVLSAFGCGDSGPTAAVEGFIKAADDKDCEKLVDYIDLKAFEAAGVTITRQELVDSCNAEPAFGELIDFKILEEKVDGESAEVKVEITSKEDGKEQTNTNTVKLNKRDGEWKIANI